MTNYITRRKERIAAKRVARDEETKHDPANGQFAPGSGGSSTASGGGINNPEAKAAQERILARKKKLASRKR